jgi:hypothetical protein
MSSSSASFLLLRFFVKALCPITLQATGTARPPRATAPVSITSPRPMSVQSRATTGGSPQSESTQHTRQAVASEVRTPLLSAKRPTLLMLCRALTGPAILRAMAASPSRRPISSPKTRAVSVVRLLLRKGAK